MVNPLKVARYTRGGDISNLMFDTRLTAKEHIYSFNVQFAKSDLCKLDTITIKRDGWRFW